MCLYTTLWNLTITIALIDFNGILHMTPQNYLSRYEAALIAQVWILWLWNQENNATMLRRRSVMSANWSSGWLMCNMGCSRQSLMKLAPVNGVNFCELLFVSEINVLSTCFNFRPLFTARRYARSIKQTTPYNNPGTLVFWRQRSQRNSDGVTSNWGAK